MHYALFYRFVKDSKTVKQPFRSAHLRYAWEASARGELILGGVLSDPEDEALLLFLPATPLKLPRISPARIPTSSTV